MKDLSATASGTAPAGPDECFAFLADFERYPDWYPHGVSAAEVLERAADGTPTKLKTTLRVSQGPIQRDFKLHMAVVLRPPRLIELRRLPKEPTDSEEMSVAWRLSPAAGGTEIAAHLEARLSIPRLLPTGGLADGMARGFLDAALSQLRR